MATSMLAGARARGAEDSIIGLPREFITRKGTPGNDRLIGDDGTDTLSGLGGDDRIDGDDGDDILSGGAGDDRIVGDNGEDRISGGAGADRIDGGEQDDLMSGGGGADLFIFDDEFEQHDTITDFSRADRIYFDADNGQEPQNFGDLTLTDTAEGLLISYEDSTLLLTGLTAADISPSQFRFD
jgi:serralysin